MIIAEFNDLWGGIEWEDEDWIRRMVTGTISTTVAEDIAVQKARKRSDRENARVEHDKALHDLDHGGRCGTVPEVHG